MADITPEVVKESHAERGHTRISPSMALRIWKPDSREPNCLGSVAMEAKAPKRSSSKDARDGTLTHDLHEEVIKCAFDKVEHRILKGEHRDERDERVGWCINLIREFGKSVNMTGLIDIHTEGYSKEHGEGEWKKVSESGRLPIITDMSEPVEGIVDFAMAWWQDYTEVAFDDEPEPAPQRKVCIAIKDLKDGVKPVEAYNNPQQILYAKGYGRYIMERYNIKASDIAYVHLQIMQPKLQAAPEATYMWEEIESLAEEAAYRFRQAEAIYLSQEDPTPYLKYDPDGCHYCAANGACSAYNKAMGAKEVVPFIDKTNPEALIPFVSHEELLKLHLSAPKIKSLLEKVEDYILRLKRDDNRLFPELKFVRKTTKNTWKEEEEVVKALLEAGLSEEQIFKKATLKSQGEIKKALPDKNLMKELVYKPQGAVVLVHQNDAREEVTKQEILKEIGDKK